MAENTRVPIWGNYDSNDIRSLQSKVLLATQINELRKGIQSGTTLHTKVNKILHAVLDDLHDDLGIAEPSQPQE